MTVRAYRVRRFPSVMPYSRRYGAGKIRLSIRSLLMERGD